jgi:hypothetical protein
MCPLGGSITIALPRGYLTAVDSTKQNTFATGGTASVARATYVYASGAVGTAVLGIADADTVTCTSASGALAAGAQVMRLIAGAVPTGSPQQILFYKIR